MLSFDILPLVDPGEFNWNPSDLLTTWNPWHYLPAAVHIIKIQPYFLSDKGKVTFLYFNNGPFNWNWDAMLIYYKYHSPMYLLSCCVVVRGIV